MCFLGDCAPGEVSYSADWVNVPAAWWTLVHRGPADLHRLGHDHLRFSSILLPILQLPDPTSAGQCHGQQQTYIHLLPQ